ncbi:MAG: DUF6338 family protein [Planctomycetes bacterium]|nr:DUF6338 family protein [Planctomycetota bacterium]
MQFSELTIRLLLLFLPGLLCHYVVDWLTVHRRRQIFEIVLHSFLFGVISYCVYAVLHFAVYILVFAATFGHVTLPTVAFERSLTDSKSPLSLVEIVLVSAVAVVLGVFFSKLVNNKTLHTIARKWKVTYKFAEHDVWGYVFDSTEMVWILLRDTDQNKMYQGRVEAYSDVEHDDFVELHLLDVQVYNEATGEFLYQSDRMYLSRNRKCITLEVCDVPQPRAGESNDAPESE